jgi:hypothetical protein
MAVTDTPDSMAVAASTAATVAEDSTAVVAGTAVDTANYQTNPPSSAFAVVWAT